MKEGFYLVPFGGAEEIGMNLNAFCVVENGEEHWILIDVGVGMAKKLGIKLILPSIEFLLKKKILGIVCTHAHEDHIGALPFVLPRFKDKIPIYSTPFTNDLIEHKLREHGVLSFADLKKIPLHSEFEVGPFKLKFIYITHSIPEPNMIFIETKFGNALHTGDWKFDDDPIVGCTTNYQEIISIGDNGGVDVLICDSTNSLEKTPTPSEGEARENLEILIKSLSGKRIIISCFASNVARVRSIIDIAKSVGRKVILQGRSLTKIFNAAVEHKYLNLDSHILHPDNMAKLKKEETLVICTGSQGEPGSVLQKLANDLFRPFKIEKGDAVVFCSRVIPGNELETKFLKNQFIRMGAEVIDASVDNKIHVSGHPSRPEIAQMIDMCKPKVVLPVHGDAYHLKGVAEVANECGVENVIIPFNGAMIHLGKHMKIIEKVHSGIDGVDGKSVISMESQMLKTRNYIYQEGCVFITLTSKRPIISYCGVLPHKVINNQDFQRTVNKIIYSVINKAPENTLLKDLTASVSGAVGSYISDHYGKRPVVIVHKEIS